MKKILIILTTFLLLGIASMGAFAALPPIPPGQDIDAQAERFRQEYSSEKRAREKAIAQALIECEKNTKPAPAPGVSFVLTGVKFTGVTIFDPKYFDFILKYYIGKRVNFVDMNNVVNMINRVYEDLGYLTTKVYLPPQDIKDGLVEIRILEGKMGDLKVEGNKYFSTPSIEKYFHTYRGEVMDAGGIQKDVMRINESKDLNVVSVLSPGQNPGDVDVTLKAQETLPYHVSIGTDNQGSRLTGRFRRIVALDDSNLTGNEDNLNINTTYTDLSSGEYLSYQDPVGTYGAKLGLDAGYFEGKEGAEYKSQDIVTYTEFYNPNATFELYESQDAQMELRSGLKLEHINKKEARNTVTDEDLRAPYLALDTIKTDSMGQTSFSPELSFGTPGFLGGSRIDNAYASRPDSDGYFTKYSQYLSRYQTMPWSSYVQIRSQFQAASHTLPTSEQLQLGGESSVRGYPEGDYLADIGGDLETEWYFPTYFIPSSWTYYGTKLRNDIEPFVFYDMGAGKLIQVNTRETESRYLAGIGGGVRFRIYNNFYLKVEWAVPTGEKPISGTGPSTFDVAFQAGT